jgi:excisionase family DNA binding protein
MPSIAEVSHLTLTEAARRVGLDRHELLALVDDGTLAAHVRGGRLMIDRAALDGLARS